MKCNRRWWNFFKTCFKKWLYILKYSLLPKTRRKPENKKVGNWRELPSIANDFWAKKRREYFRGEFVWSGLRGSNSLPPPWQGGALPDELNPQMATRKRLELSTSAVTGRRSNQLNYRAKFRKLTNNPRYFGHHQTSYGRENKAVVEVEGLEPPTLCL